MKRLAIVLILLLCAAVHADTLSQYVDTTDNGGTWDEVGTTPWLGAQDQPTNYIHNNDRNDNSDNFGFTDTSETGTINSVHLYVYCTSVAETDFDIYLNAADTGLGPGTSWGWVNVDVSATLDTWAKINSATVMFDRKNNTNNSQVDAAYLYIDYTPSGGFSGAQVFTAGASVLGLMLLGTVRFHGAGRYD